MEIFITQSTLDKLESMIKDNKPGSISVRKYNEEKDDLNKGQCIKGLKLTDTQLKKHELGISYSIYINKEQLKKMKENVKDGGFFPALLPFLPAILGAVGATAGVGTLASTIAKTVNEAKTQNSQLEEQKRHNAVIEKNSWKEGTSIDIKNFVNKSNLSDTGKRTFRSFMKNLHTGNKFDIKYDGEALSLRPLFS